MTRMLLSLLAWSLHAVLPQLVFGLDEGSQVTVKVSISRSAHDATVFNGTLVMSVRDDSSMSDVFLRFATKDGKSVDSARLQSEMEELRIPASDLFLGNSQECHLRLLVYAPQYVTGRDITFVKAGENSIEARVVMESRDAYRRWAKKDDTRPRLSALLREDARHLDPVVHKTLREQMQSDAAEEEKLETEEDIEIGPLGLILPAYIYPPSAGAIADKANRLAQLNAADWTAIQQAVEELSKANIRSLVIVNPWIAANASIVPEYSEKIRFLRQHGATPLGYVSLGRGSGSTRQYDSANVVLQRLQDWKRLYPDIQGIFFDVCPTAREHFDHVDQLAMFARQQFPGAMIVLNPGTVPDSAYLNSPNVDVVCTCESNQGASVAKPASKSSSNLAAILWGNRNPLPGEIAQLKQNKYKYVYVTDRDTTIDLDGKPGADDNLQWGRLPSVNKWKELVRLLKESSTGTVPTSEKQKLP